MHNGTASPPHSTLPGRSAWRMLAVLIFWSMIPGCVTPWEKFALMKDTTPSIDKVQGPTERRLRDYFWKSRQAEEDDGSGSLKPIAGTEEYLAATDLYKNEEFADARKAFKRVAKKYKRSEIREDALFMQGEAEFQQEHYSAAHDQYAMLLKEFPSSRHLDVVSERLFKIGRLWLDFPEVAKLNEIQQVNLEEPQRKLPAEEPAKTSSSPVFVPNFTNKERPLFDTPGNGVAALQAIWMNDPTGPLADDAMMLVASHHARQGNYVESDRYFRMLRETFPNSPHLKDAFLIGSHVKLMSYQGANYDGKTLNDAQMLKESTLRLYPDIQESERLKEELAKIEAAKAEIDWQQVELWLRKGNKRAAAVMCHQLIHSYPRAARAEDARLKLESLGPEYVSGAVLLSPLDPPKPPLWRRALGLPAAELPPHQPVASAPNPKAPAERYDGESNSEQPPSRRIQNPFRRRPAPTESDASELEPDETGSSPSEPAAPRKRNWLWPIPQRLPAEVDDDARKLEVDEPSGQSKL